MGMKLAGFTPVPKGPGGLERIYLDHKDGKFLSSEGPDSPTLRRIDYHGFYKFIPLGLIRQRQMWPEFGSATALANKGKQCISIDGDNGIPQPNFPWEEHWATPEDVDTLECRTCPFQKWADGKSPRCQPRWYVPALPDLPYDQIYGNGYLEPDTYEIDPFIFDFTQSGITQIKNYLNNQISDKTSIWERVIIVNVDVNYKNNRTYASPIFNKGRSIDRDYYPLFIAHARRVRAKLEMAALPSKTSRPTIAALTPKS